MVPRRTRPSPPLARPRGSVARSSPQRREAHGRTPRRALPAAAGAETHRCLRNGASRARRSPASRAGPGRRRSRKCGPARARRAAPRRTAMAPTSARRPEAVAGRPWSAVTNAGESLGDTPPASARPRGARCRDKSDGAERQTWHSRATRGLSFLTWGASRFRVWLYKKMVPASPPRVSLVRRRARDGGGDVLPRDGPPDVWGRRRVRKLVRVARYPGSFSRPFRVPALRGEKRFSQAEHPDARRLRRPSSIPSSIPVIRDLCRPAGASPAASRA